VNLTAGILAIGVAAAAAGCAIDVRSTCAAAGETHPRGRAFDGARASRRRSRPARRVGASTSAARTRASSASQEQEQKARHEREQAETLGRVGRHGDRRTWDRPRGLIAQPGARRGRRRSPTRVDGSHTTTFTTISGTSALGSGSEARCPITPTTDTIRTTRRMTRSRTGTRPRSTVVLLPELRGVLPERDELPADVGAGPGVLTRAPGVIALLSARRPASVPASRAAPPLPGKPRRS
jgi:hypothetical protein